jgi:hypothetical protein
MLETAGVGPSNPAATAVLPLTTSGSQPDVTLAVDTAGGGRSRDSNGLTDWTPVEPLTLQGTVQEVD